MGTYIFLTTIIAASIILLAGGYFLIRNHYVCKFRNKVNVLCFDYFTRHENEKDDNAYKWCYDKLPEYDKMVYSFKPLTLESYFGEDIAKKLVS